jgi:hypothetical protein
LEKLRELGVERDVTHAVRGLRRADLAGLRIGGPLDADVPAPEVDVAPLQRERLAEAEACVGEDAGDAAMLQGCDREHDQDNVVRGETLVLLRPRGVGFAGRVSFAGNGFATRKLLRRRPKGSTERGGALRVASSSTGPRRVSA